MGIHFHPMCLRWGQEEKEPSRDMRDGNPGASWGSLIWQQFPILLPLQWGERPRLMSHSSVLQEGEEGKIPAQVKALVSAPGRRKCEWWCSFFAAVQLQPCFGAQNLLLQQTPAPPAPKPSSRVPGTFNKTPVLNSGLALYHAQNSCHGEVTE